MQGTDHRDTKTRRIDLLGLCVTVAFLFLLVTEGCGLRSRPPIERARAAWEDRDYESAAAAYEEYLAGAPQGPEAEEAEFQLADIYYLKLKQYERARDHYAAFLAAHPESRHLCEGQRRLAEVYAQLGDRTDAIAGYETLSTTCVDAEEWRKTRLLIADLYFDSDDFSQAELEYGRIATQGEYDSVTEQAMLRMGSIYHNVRHQEERALEDYRRVASATSDPEVRWRALYSLSDCYASLFRFDEAIQALRSIDDPKQADYVAKRVSELERQKREHQDAPEIDWGHGRGEGDGR